MRYPTLPAVGILSVSALLAITGCHAPAAEHASAVSAPITIATIPRGDDPTQANPIEAWQPGWGQSTRMLTPRTPGPKQ
jgi:phosphonate transport system substrate-binding protein